MLFLVLQKTERVFCRDPSLFVTPSDSDTDLTVASADDSTEEEEEEQDTDCLYCTGRFSEVHNVE